MNTLEVSKASDQKFCHACAKVLHNSAGFCPSCGAQQSLAAPVTSTATNATPPSASMQRTTADQCHCHGCGSVIHATAPTCPHCGAAQRMATSPNYGHAPNPRSRVTAILLAFFLGGFGAHKFYCGKTGLGFLYLVFFWTWITSLVALVEGIIYLTGTNDQEFTQKYCV